MCGIFGYVSQKKEPADTILEGLKLLEYRGYDSWGIAVKDNNHLQIEKHIGKITESHASLSQSEAGIGHTRWATHGGVTMANAHPQTNLKKTIAVVHNGIIENFQELKKELIHKGYVFTSETDTEVVPHLVEEYLKKHNFVTSVREAFKRLDGLNALVVLYAPTNEIIAIKNGSPLVVGVSNTSVYIASDVVGIVPHTKKVYFLEDGQMAVLGKNISVLNIQNGKKLSIKYTTINWRFESVTKGKYPHFLLKEIHEQPAIIKNIALSYGNQIKSLANQIRLAYGTFMVGCGTASYAALTGTYVFSKVAKRHINWSVGSEFNYLEDYLTPKTLLIPISQSGETIDITQPVTAAKKRKTRIAAITNVLGSTLYRFADTNLLLGTGPEKAVVATKSFTAMLTVLIYSAYSVVNKDKKAHQLLTSASKGIEQLLAPKNSEKIRKLAAQLSKENHIYILGRGISYAAALECALKIKETAYVHAEGFAGGELKHGVITLIDKNTPCIVIAPNDETYPEIISNAQEVKARGGKIIGIGPKPDPVFDIFIQTADCEIATIIPQVVVAQLLGYYLALERGIADPDKPRNLAKSVTVK